MARCLDDAGRSRVVGCVHGQTNWAAETYGLHTIMRTLDDALMLLLTIFLFPLTILVIGAPIVLFVRVVIEVAHRLL